MKWLKYNILLGHRQEIDEEGAIIEKEILLEKRAPDNEEGLAIAQSEAHGEIVHYDDGEPEYTEEPSQLDLIEAQVTYTAMMTDTLLEV